MVWLDRVRIGRARRTETTRSEVSSDHVDHAATTGRSAPLAARAHSSCSSGGQSLDESHAGLRQPGWQRPQTDRLAESYRPPSRPGSVWFTGAVSEAYPDYAIVGIDLDVKDDEARYTVRRIVWSEELAETEVRRREELNADKRCRYFWQ